LYRWQVTFYPGHEPLSTDGSRNIVKKYKNAVLIDAPNLLEYQKRQKYCEIAGKYGIDVLIIVDSDEFAIPHLTNWDIFRKNLYIYNHTMR
jgi:uncharacterized protein YueI